MLESWKYQQIPLEITKKEKKAHTKDKRQNCLLLKGIKDILKR